MSWADGALLQGFIHGVTTSNLFQKEPPGDGVEGRLESTILEHG